MTTTMPEDDAEEEEQTSQSGMVRVRQLLQSVHKSVNKTLGKSRAKEAARQHYTETPNDVQELLNRFSRGQKALLQIPDKRVEYTDGMENAVAAKDSFDTLLRELGETRSSYQLAEATTAVADTLLKVQDVQSRAEQAVVEFLFAMGRQERKYTGAITEHVNHLDVLRSALDKVVSKQKIAAETRGPGIDPEKVARRRQKVVARRMAFEDQVAFLRDAIPQIELQADAAYCQALIEMLGHQRESISEQARMLGELDARMQEAEALAAEAMLSLKSKEGEEERKQELAVAEACGPRIVELLSAPDFAAALCIAELCASPVGEIEQGEDVIKCLLRLLDDSDLCVPLLKFAISTELPRAPSDAAAVSLFRKPSLAGALCSAALQMSGGSYLKVSLAPLVAQICSGEADFEIDPRRLSADDDVNVNIDNLCKAVQWFSDTIVHSIRDAPALIRALCAHIFNILGPNQRPLARRVAASLLIDSFICEALRDVTGRGVAEAPPEERSQRVLEQIARSLSRAVDEHSLQATASSVFAAAAMSDFAFDLPDPPRDLVRVIQENRQRFVGEGGIVDQLAGLADFEDAGTYASDLYLAGGHEPVEEVADILMLRRLLAANVCALSGILASRGFHAHIEALEACVRGVSDDQAAQDMRGRNLLPGSNQPAPVEKNRWTETWSGPEDDVWVEGDEEVDAGMLDGERILGEVISKPDKAAGLGAVTGERISLAQRLGVKVYEHPHAESPSKSVGSARKTYADGEIEDADSMPDSAPERLPGRALQQDAQHPFDASPRVVERVTGVEEVAADVAFTSRGMAAREASGDESDQTLLKPRRKFTKTAAVGVGLRLKSRDVAVEDGSSKSGAADSGDGSSNDGMRGPEAEEHLAIVDRAIEPEVWAGLAAGDGWSVSPSQDGKQPVLRRTQRTVTIRGRAEEEDDEEAHAGGDSMEVVPKHSIRTTASSATGAGPRATGQEGSVGHGQAGRGDGGGDRGDPHGPLAGEPATAVPGGGGGVGRLFGVGAAFKRNADGFFYVKKVVNDGPADKAGVKAGSRVVSMDGERLYGKTVEQLFKLVLGSEGTTLKLALQQAGSGVRTPEQVVLVRRAFIDESFLNASAIEPLSKTVAAASSDGSARAVGGGAWARHQGGVPAPALGPLHMMAHTVGIGVTFKKDGEGYYVVKKLSEHGGAFLSGLLAVGDRVLAIDGHSMHRKSSQELSRCVLGLEGTSVTLSVRSGDGAVRDIQVRRVREQGAEGENAAADEGSGPRNGHTSNEIGAADGDWEGGGTAAQGQEWDGQGEVMRMDGNPAEGLVGIGATLVRDSRGLFVVAEVAPPPHGAPQGRSYNLFVGDIIVQVDGIQATGKPVETVEGLILGPVGSLIELVMAQGVGGGTRTVRTVRRPNGTWSTGQGVLAAPAVLQPAAADEGASSASSASGRRQIVPLAPPGQRGGAASSSSAPADKTQVGLVVAYQQVDAGDEDSVFGSGGLRVTDVLEHLSIGRHEHVETGDIILQVDGVAVPPDANETMLYGPPGSVVTLTVKKPPPDGRVLELMLTRATASKALGEVSVTSAAASAAQASGGPPTLPSASPELDGSHASGPCPNSPKGEGTLQAAEDGGEVHDGVGPGEGAGRQGDDDIDESTP